MYSNTVTANTSDIYIYQLILHIVSFFSDEAEAKETFGRVLSLHQPSFGY